MACGTGTTLPLDSIIHPPLSTQNTSHPIYLLPSPLWPKSPPVPPAHSSPPSLRLPITTESVSPLSFRTGTHITSLNVDICSPINIHIDKLRRFISLEDPDVGLLPLLPDSVIHSIALDDDLALPIFNNHLGLLKHVQNLNASYEHIRNHFDNLSFPSVKHMPTPNHLPPASTLPNTVSTVNSVLTTSSSSLSPPSPEDAPSVAASMHNPSNQPLEFPPLPSNISIRPTPPPLASNSSSVEFAPSAPINHDDKYSISINYRILVPANGTAPVPHIIVHDVNTAIAKQNILGNFCT